MEKFILVCMSLAIFAGLSSGYMSRSIHFDESHEAMLKYSESFVPEFIQEYQTYYETGNKSEKLSEMMSYVQLPQQLRKYEIDDVPEQYGFITCLGCRAGAGIILDYRRRGKNEAFLNDVAIDLCKGLNIQPNEVCEKIVPINLEPIVYIVDSRPKLTGDAICALVLQGSCGELPEDIQFKVNIDDNVEEISKAKDEAVPRSDNEMKILHFTDIHFQPNYLVGGQANCKEPLCCRSVKGLAEKEEDKAGYWGDYRDCDIPIHTVVNALDQIAEHAKDVDLIYYTGDIIDHSVWETSQLSNLESMEIIHGLFKEKFPNSMVIPVPGNHEAHPVNVFAPTSVRRPTININWLYEYLADTYSTWLPADTMETIKKGAYYTLLVKPGFRIIALNNNDCYTYNWWVLYGQGSMAEQLQWFHDTLLAAEKAGERVHVVIHIPSGEGSCNQVWSREYTRVIERFHRIISAQFTGHTHRDEFYIYYDRPNGVHATSVSWNAGSLTTFSDVNPNYAVYYVDNELYQVNEYESWIFNLTEANLHPEKSPVWYKQYSFKEAFGLNDLSPASMDQLVYSMARDQNKLNQYFTYKVKNGDPFLAKGCNRECQESLLCEIVITEFGDTRKCNELKSILRTVS